MKRKCYRCDEEGHLKRDCPRNRLRVVAAPEAAGLPDLSAAHAYWDTSAPLVPIEVAWDGPGAESPARVAREMRLRGEAARQVEESRAARGVL